MTFRTILLTSAVTLCTSLVACSPATTAPSTVPSANAQSTSETAQTPTGEDITTAVTGVYTGDPSHTYVGLTYMHQGYARATIRVDNVQIKLDLDAASPEAASLDVMMKANEISSGTDKFDEHLMSADFFDAETYPDMTFKSTKLVMNTPSTGTVTGNLTIKDVTKPVTLDVTLNKIGQNFRSKADMLGVSARGEVSRTDFGLGKYAPMVGDTVAIVIEAEMAIETE